MKRKTAPVPVLLKSVRKVEFFESQKSLRLVKLLFTWYLKIKLGTLCSNRNVKS